MYKLTIRDSIKTHVILFKIKKKTYNFVKRLFLLKIMKIKTHQIISVNCDIVSNCE